MKDPREGWPGIKSNKPSAIMSIMGMAPKGAPDESAPSEEPMPEEEGGGGGELSPELKAQVDAMSPEERQCLKDYCDECGCDKETEGGGEAPEPE
jgi:hypothetical protein